MRLADFIVYPAYHLDGILDVFKLAIAFQIGAVEFDVVADMSFVLMGINHKLMLSIDEFH